MMACYVYRCETGKKKTSLKEMEVPEIKQLREHPRVFLKLESRDYYF